MELRCAYSKPDNDMYDMSMAQIGMRQDSKRLFRPRPNAAVEVLVAQSAEKRHAHAISFEQAMVKYGIAKAEYPVHPHRASADIQIRIETEKRLYSL